MSVYACSRKQSTSQSPSRCSKSRSASSVRQNLMSHKFQPIPLHAIKNVLPTSGEQVHQTSYQTWGRNISPMTAESLPFSVCDLTGKALGLNQIHARNKFHRLDPVQQDCCLDMIFLQQCIQFTWQRSKCREIQKKLLAARIEVSSSWTRTLFPPRKSFILPQKTLRALACCSLCLHFWRGICLCRCFCKLLLYRDVNSRCLLG